VCFCDYGALLDCRCNPHAAEKGRGPACRYTNASFVTRRAKLDVVVVEKLRRGDEVVVVELDEGGGAELRRTETGAVARSVLCARCAWGCALNSRAVPLTAGCGARALWADRVSSPARTDRNPPGPLFPRAQCIFTGTIRRSVFVSRHHRRWRRIAVTRTRVAVGVGDGHRHGAPGLEYSRRSANLKQLRPRN